MKFGMAIAGVVTLGTMTSLPFRVAAGEEMPLKKPPVVAIGTVNLVTLGGKRLRAASDRETPEARVREYVPAGEDAESWTARFSQHEFRRAISPVRYANAITELTASQGGKVISTAAGPGESATVALVLHSLTQPVSEVTAWRFFVRDGRLISLQYTERVEGENHFADAENLAREKSAEWVRELQIQRPVGTFEAIKTAQTGEALETGK